MFPPHFVENCGAPTFFAPRGVHSIVDFVFLGFNSLSFCSRDQMFFKKMGAYHFIEIYTVTPIFPSLGTGGW